MRLLDVRSMPTQDSKIPQVYPLSQLALNIIIIYRPAMEVSKQAGPHLDQWLRKAVQDRGKVEALLGLNPALLLLLLLALGQLVAGLTLPSYTWACSSSSNRSSSNM
jgi:hypothetical protein